MADFTPGITFTNINDAFSGRSVTGAVLSSHRDAFAFQIGGPPGPGKDGLREFEIERPTTIPLDGPSTLAKSVASANMNIKEAIDRQEKEKVALETTLTQFTECVEKLRNTGTELLGVSASQLPGNQTAVKLFTLLKTDLELLLVELEKEFNTSCQTTLEELKSHLEHNYANRAELLKFMAECFQEVHGEKKGSCAVCYDDTANMCLVPCGHTYCSGCANKMDTCAICKGTIEKTIKIYSSV